MHLKAKKKLFTDDLINAIVIAAKNGMLCHHTNAARWAAAFR